MAQKVGLFPKDVSLPDFFQPPLCFKEVILKVSLEPMTMAGIDFPAGLLLNASGYIFGKEFGIMLNVGLINAEAKAYLKTLNFGPISISGLGCDLKAGTADDGICFWFKFSMPSGEDVGMEISSEDNGNGGRRLLGLPTARTTQLSASDTIKEAMNKFVLFFRFTGEFTALGFFKVGALMELSLKGMLINFVHWMGFARVSFTVSCGENSGAAASSNTDFTVAFVMWTEGLQNIAKQITEGLTEFGKKANAAIDEANASIKKAADKLRETCDSIGMGEAPSDYSPAATAERKAKAEAAQKEADEAEAESATQEKEAAEALAKKENAEKMTVSPGTGTAAPIVDKWTAQANAEHLPAARKD
jgi:hypothetical protein